MTWCGLKIKENYNVLVNQFHGNFRSKTLSCREIKYVFRDVKWCFNASWGLKGLIIDCHSCAERRLFLKFTIIHLECRSAYFMSGKLSFWWIPLSNWCIPNFDLRDEEKIKRLAVVENDTALDWSDASFLTILSSLNFQITLLNAEHDYLLVD